jgi:hypothetical protein
VASIYSSYPVSIICRTLGISGGQLKKAMEGGCFAVFNAKAPAPLTVMQQHEDKLPPCEVSLEYGSAKLTIKIPTEVCAPIITQLVGYLR